MVTLPRIICFFHETPLPAWDHPAFEDEKVAGDARIGQDDDEKLISHTDGRLQAVLLRPGVDGKFGVGVVDVGIGG